MSLWVNISTICATFVVILLIAKQMLWIPRRLRNVENKHVVITGGSSGIGKCVAIIAAKNGAHVTIIARDVQKLEAAKNDIIRACKNKGSQKVECLSLDISSNYENVEKAILDLEKSMGPTYMLVNCAGFAVCGKIEDTSAENMNKMMNTNFVGTFYCIKAVVQRMKTAKEGIIVLTGSQASMIGIFGYSAYCSTKFALRGLAESISMELTPYNIFVTLCMPPDTDTPGYSVEEQSKPLETKLITQSDILVDPAVVAKRLFDDALAGKFLSSVGLDGVVLSIACAGMSPVTSFCELLLQFLIMGPMRLVCVFYLLSFQKIIRNCIKTRDQNKKSE